MKVEVPNNKPTRAEINMFSIGGLLVSTSLLLPGDWPQGWSEITHTGLWCVGFFCFIVTLLLERMRRFDSPL